MRQRLEERDPAGVRPGRRVLPVESPRRVVRLGHPRRAQPLGVAARRRRRRKLSLAASTARSMSRASRRADCVARSGGTNFSGFFASPVVREEEVFTAVASFLFGRRNCGPCDAAPRSSAASSAARRGASARGAERPRGGLGARGGAAKRRRASIVHHASRDAREELALEALGVFAAGDDERSSRRVHHLVHRRLRGRGLPEQRRLRRLRVPRPALVRAAERRRAAARERAARRRARRRRVPRSSVARDAREDASSRAAASHSEPSPTPSAPRRRRLPIAARKTRRAADGETGRPPPPPPPPPRRRTTFPSRSRSRAPRGPARTSSTASSSPRSANANASNASNASSLGGTTSAAPSASSIPPGGDGPRPRGAPKRDPSGSGSVPGVPAAPPRPNAANDAEPGGRRGARRSRRGSPKPTGLFPPRSSRGGASGSAGPERGQRRDGREAEGGGRSLGAPSRRRRVSVRFRRRRGGRAPGRLSPRGRGGARRRRRVRPSGRRRRRLSRDAPRCVSSDGPRRARAARARRGRRASRAPRHRAGARRGGALGGRGDERVVEALEGVRGVAVPASAHGERGAREAEGVALGAIVGAKARAARLGRVVHREQDVEGAARQATRRGGVPRDGVGRVLADAVRAERALRERLEPTPERQSALGRVRARRSLGRHRRARRVLAPARGGGAVRARAARRRLPQWDGSPRTRDGGREGPVPCASTFETLPHTRVSSDESSAPAPGAGPGLGRRRPDAPRTRRRARHAARADSLPRCSRPRPRTPPRESRRRRRPVRARDCRRSARRGRDG